MRRRAFHAPHPFGEVNVTPMIDVVMVLIVFYLIVGKLASEQRARLDLPDAAAHARIDDEPITIDLPRDGPLKLAGRPVRAELLAEALAQRVDAEPERPILVRADASLPYNEVEPILRTCRASGRQVVRLATEPVP